MLALQPKNLGAFELCTRSSQSAFEPWNRPLVAASVLEPWNGTLATATAPSNLRIVLPLHLQPHLHTCTDAQYAIPDAYATHLDVESDNTRRIHGGQTCILLDIRSIFGRRIRRRKAHIRRPDIRFTRHM